MKLIGKQIVVELPERLPSKNRHYAKYVQDHDDGWNQALSEVAKMNPAWEVDEEKMTSIINEWGNKNVSLLYKGSFFLAKFLTLNLSKWLKRKDSR